MIVEKVQRLPNAVQEIFSFAEIVVYPNPAEGHIFISGLKHKVDYWLFNSLGEQVMHSTVKQAFQNKSGCN